MHEILQGLAHFFYSLGGLGLLLLGTLDSSFLMLPLGNDLLVVALTAARPEHMVYYVVMSTLGSIAGVALAHAVSSRTGKQVIEGENKGKKVAYVERQVKKYGGLAIGVAALAPPGFPFTAFIVVPAALQYPLKRMLAIIGACRLVRFLVDGWLALIYGPRILEMAKSPVLQRLLIALIVVSIAGSAISIRSWIKQARTRRPA
jgi:membrane protein YqaA with SNARE-associated domain